MKFFAVPTSLMVRQTVRQTDLQIDETDRHTVRLTDRHVEIQTDRQTDSMVWYGSYANMSFDGQIVA